MSRNAILLTLAVFACMAGVAQAAGNGLIGEYFTVTGFPTDTATQFVPANLALTRIDPTIDFAWGNGAVGGVRDDGVGVRWSGAIEAGFTETYTFETNTDDGIRVWINDVLVLENWTNHGPTLDTGTIALTAGLQYPIIVEFYENGGGAICHLRWESPSTPKAIVPQANLYGIIPPAPPKNPDPANDGLVSLWKGQQA